MVSIGCVTVCSIGVVFPSDKRSDRCQGALVYGVFSLFFSIIIDCVFRQWDGNGWGYNRVVQGNVWGCEEWGSGGIYGVREPVCA